MNRFVFFVSVLYVLSLCSNPKVKLSHARTSDAFGEAVEDVFDAGAEKKKIEDAGGPISQPGDMWLLGDHILICGDPADKEIWKRLMGTDKAQCTITVPPIDSKEYTQHGIDPWLGRMEKVLSLLIPFSEIVCWQVSDLAKTGSQYIEPLNLHSMRLFSDQNFRPIWTRVWKMTGIVPSAGALQNSSNKPSSDFDLVTAFAGNDLEAYNDQEYAWVSAYAAHAFRFVRRLTREERRKWGYAGVWEIAAMRSNPDGDRQIPIELPWRCLKMHSDLHGIVTDPFAGLGSTLIACEQSGLRCRAIESDPMHCDLIVRRWEQFTGETAEKVER